MKTEELRDAVIDIVSQIPQGRLLTYGRIAQLAGWPNHSRLVGKIMSELINGEQLPCHRVVNASGRTAPGWEEQRELLCKEGVTIKEKGCVDLKLHMWKPE